MHEIHTSRRVEFEDTDMAGIIHFSRYLAFMEAAEHEFRRQAGWSVHAVVEAGAMGWPRLACGCEFLRPVRFEDTLEIRLFLLEKSRGSLTFGCEFRCQGELVARGQISSVCCILSPGRPLEAVEMPAELSALLVEASPEEKRSWKPPIRPFSS